MSYSYIKSVFPNFETDTNPSIYDAQLSLASPSQNESQSTPTPYENQGIPVENFGQTTPTDKSNLTFYIPPVPKVTVEAFEPKTDTPPAGCDDYLRHVVKCKQCMQTLRKQLGMSSVDYEEILEVLSFILFGVFLLMILDRIKR